MYTFTLEFAYGVESMGNLILPKFLDPANQSEITDVSVWLLLFFLKNLEGFVVYFQKIWTSVFQIPECFANQVSTAIFSVAF